MKAELVVKAASGDEPFPIRGTRVTIGRGVSAHLRVADGLASREHCVVERVGDQFVLRDLGIGLWLDDFGTGHSSLEWLSHFPLDGVKIAATFVERLPHDRRCQVIAGHVIDMAHDLGLRVIAEGVETPEQREMLAGHGCDLFQGFLFHSALAAEDLPAALAPP